MRLKPDGKVTESAIGVTRPEGLPLIISEAPSIFAVIKTEEGAESVPAPNAARGKRAVKNIKNINNLDNAFFKGNLSRILSQKR